MPRLPLEDFSEPPMRESEAPDRRQLDYANALFTRKLYDLAIPEYQKYLDDYRGYAGRANAYFSLGECYRNLKRPSSARTNFQKVLSDYGDGEFAGPSAYALAEMAFTEKDYAGALLLFHRAAAKKRKPVIFIWRLPRLEIRIPIARMHDGQRHLFSLGGEEKSMRLSNTKRFRTKRKSQL